MLLFNHNEYDAFFKCIVFAENPEFGKQVIEKYSNQKLVGSVGICYIVKQSICDGMRVKYQVWNLDQSAIFSDATTYYNKPGSMLRAPHVALFVYDMDNPNLEKVELYTQIINEWYGDNDNPPLIYIVGIQTKTSTKDDSAISEFVRRSDRPNNSWINHIGLESNTSKTSLADLFNDIARLLIARLNLKRPEFASSSPHPDGDSGYLTERTKLVKDPKHTAPTAQPDVGRNNEPNADDGQRRCSILCCSIL